MKIENIKISGFRAIPFCAQYQENPPQVKWNDCSFQISFSISSPFLYTIIGSNSVGKSSVFLALQYFFSNTTKLVNDELYNNKDTSQPIIIEVSFIGNIKDSDEWHKTNCERIGENLRLTLLSVATPESRINFIRKPNGELKKQSTSDKDKILNLSPRFRLVPADAKLSDEVNPDKKNLVSDLIDEILVATQTSSTRSIVRKIQKNLDQLNQLLVRDNLNNSSSWREIERLENLLSSGLSDLTPGKPQVHFSMKENIPTLESLFHKGRFRISDGIDIGIENHGLGLQRSFLVSILNTWIKTVCHKQDNQDYFFAIEEPELYLHPHGIRLLISVLNEIADNNQVIFSSHVCEFVNSVPLENVIKIKRQLNDRSIIQPNLNELKAKEKDKVHRYLHEDRSDMLFARAVLLVEGQSELFAIPSFARTLGIDLNKQGVSVVFVNGNMNFSTYHHILKAFGIPHVILADGDGNKENKQKQLAPLADHAIVLDEDFEYLAASVLSDDRLLKIINLCRQQKGEHPLKSLELTEITAAQLSTDWWKKIEEKINADISPEFRKNYVPYKRQLKTILTQISVVAIDNNHLLPSNFSKKRAELLKKQTKPLVGRILGNQLTKSEILAMSEMCDAINKVIDLAN